MKQIDISVILPCYNAESCLEEIYSDLQKQSFKNFEMIFVNDGGSRKQAEIIHNLAQKDNRILVINKTNGGVSSARNKGLEAANGNWIVFVDPDDRVEPYYLQCLFDAVNNSKSIVGIAGFHQYFVKQNKTQDYLIFQNQNDVPLSSCFNLLSEYNKYLVWNKIYNRKFLQKNNLKFDESITYQEDKNFNIKVFLQVSTVSLRKDCGYKYMMKGNSSCSSYHVALKESFDENEKMEEKLMLKCGMLLEDIESQRIRMVLFNIYVLVLNLYRKGSVLTFFNKVQYIKKNILDDEEMMHRLLLHKTNDDSWILRLLAKLVKRQQTYFIVSLFSLLSCLKSTFAAIYFLYDRYCTGKYGG